MYHEAVKIAYPERTIEKAEEHGSKIEKTYTDKFKEKYGFGFSKTRVAQSLKKKLMEDRKIDRITKGNLEKLAKEIVTRLTNFK